MEIRFDNFEVYYVKANFTYKDKRYGLMFRYHDQTEVATARKLLYQAADNTVEMIDAGHGGISGKPYFMEHEEGDEYLIFNLEDYK